MKEESKKMIVANLLDLIEKNKKTDADLDLIINYLPFFGKEIINNLINPILEIEKSFKIVDKFEILMSDKKGYSVTFVEVTHNISAELCVKKIKILSHPGRTVFLGIEGIKILTECAPEKLKGRKIITFSSKFSIDTKNYIPGVSTLSNNKLNQTLFVFNTLIMKGYVIAVFKQI